MELWIINAIGIFLFFLIRYENRKTKKRFDFWYWVRDNWVELFSTLLINIAIMMIITHPEVNVDPTEFLKKYIPFDFSIAAYSGKLIVCFLSGLGFSAGLYRIIKGLKSIKFGK